MSSLDRRTVLSHFAAVGLLAVLPTGCATRRTGAPSQAVAAQISPPGLPPIPAIPPADWDPIAFNRARGHAGAIPESYWPAIDGPDGDTAHLGKHLPWIPALPHVTLPDGYVGLMWGDPGKGHVPHPNAAPSPELPQGHFYDWVRLRRATEDEATEVTSTFSSWPTTEPGDTGTYTGHDGGPPDADGGRNTVQVCRLPDDVRPGDLVRVHAHCRTHGEYVDFVRV